MEAQEGACEPEAEVVLGTELLMVLTREGNENLRDTVGMIKCKFLCNAISLRSWCNTWCASVVC